MKLHEVFAEANIIANLQATHKIDTLQELVAHLARSGTLKDEEAEDIERALMRREELGSTGIGKGVAVPHAKHPSVEGVVGAFGRSAAGIEFESLDGQPVNLVFLLLSSPEAVEPHLNALRRVTMLLRDGDICTFLKRAATAQELTALMAEADERLGG